MTTRRTSATSTLTARVLKALSVFGSLEVVNMACAVVRTKLVALWIGAAGVGVISLFNSTMGMLQYVLLLNLRAGAVRDIAAADDAGRDAVCKATTRLGLIIGVVSSIIVAALSTLLSRVTFGTSDYTWTFAVLSLTMFTSAVADSRRAVLQGLARLRRLAVASLWGGVVSTVVAVPMFYWWRMDAIVPVLLVFSFVTAAFLIVQPTGLAPSKYGRAELTAPMKSIIRFGGYITVAIGFTLLADYALRVYLNSSASIEAVGHLQAGYTVVNSYVGIIFTAIAMEFYPRLAAVASRRRRAEVIVAHEVTIVQWILLPVVIVFLSADQLIVRVLYSESFIIDAVEYMSPAIVGVMLRGSSWCMSYVMLANSDGRAYVVTEIASSLLMLGLSIALWQGYGFAGLGAAYLIQYIVYAAMTYGVYRVRYRMRMPAAVVRLIVAMPLIAGAALAMRLTLGWWAPLLLLPFILPPALKILRR